MPLDPKTDPALASFVPLDLDESKRAKLHSTLTALHSRSTRDLAPYFEKIKLWRDLYEGNIKPTVKPWKDSSEIFFPLAKMIADAASSSIHGRIFQQKDVAAVESPMQASDYARENADADLDQDLSALRRFINHIALEPEELNLKARFDALFAEEANVGTAVIRIFHDYQTVDKKKVRKEDGTIEIQGSDGTPVVIKDKIRVQIVPIEQCFWDTTATDDEDLRMFGFNTTKSLSEVLQLAKQQKWPDMIRDRILASPDAAPSDADQRAAERENVENSIATENVTVNNRLIELSPFAQYTFREVFLTNQDVDMDGIIEDSITIWHPLSGQIPRVILFPYIHNKMPALLAHYEQRRNRNIGIGTTEPIVSLAAGVNVVGNQTVDAQSIRNCPSIVTPEMSDAGLTIEDGGWYPGIHLTESIQGEVRTLEFGQSNNTVVSFSIFDRLVDMAFRISHLGPSQFGDVSVGQRVASTVGQSIQASGNLLIEKIIDRNRLKASCVISQALSLYWQFQRQKFTQVLGADDASKVERLFATIGLNRLRIRLNITSGTSSTELDRQNLLGLDQSLTASHRGMLELVNLIVGGGPGPDGQPQPGNPELGSAAVKVLKSRQDFLIKLIESFPNINDSEPFVPDLAGDLEEKLEQNAQTAPPGALNVPPAGPSIPGAGGPGPGAGNILP